MYICMWNIHQISHLQIWYKNSKEEPQEKSKRNFQSSQNDIGDNTSGEQDMEHGVREILQMKWCRHILNTTETPQMLITKILYWSRS